MPAEQGCGTGKTSGKKQDHQSVTSGIRFKGKGDTDTALLLGFEFPHHFTRLFKKVTGLTPTEFLA